jgi:hypothetical protein
MRLDCKQRSILVSSSSMSVLSYYKTRRHVMVFDKIVAVIVAMVVAVTVHSTTIIVRLDPLV